MEIIRTEKQKLETIPRVFKRIVQKYGSRVAMRYKDYGLWHDITWNEYYSQVRNLGSALISMGIKKGDCISIIGDNSPEWVYADMAGMCIGGTVAGVYATNAWQQVKYVVSNSESKIFFVENEEQLDKWLRFRDEVPGLEKVVVWDTKGLRQFKDPMVISFEEFLEIGEKKFKEDPGLFETHAAKVRRDDLALLIYTSGTTGPPKGAMLDHENLVWMGRAILKINPMDEKDEVLSFLPLCHIFEQLFTVICHLSAGHVVNFIESPETVADNMIEVSPTVGYAVPRIWEKYYSAVKIRMSDATWFKRVFFNVALKTGGKRAALTMNFKQVPIFLEIAYRFFYFCIFRKLKERLGFDRIWVAYSGAAPIAPDVLHFFQSIGINLIEAYGQTEGTGVSTMPKIGRVKFGTVGQEIPGSEIRIAEDGEILLKSPAVFKGYYNNAEATAETIKDGWLYSGDIGEIDRDGFLRIIDRKKDILITAGGKNITPQLIENKLKASIYINDAVVIGDKRKYLTCLIMIDEDNVVKYAQDHKIQFSTYRDLTMSPEIIKLIQEEVDSVNSSLARVENIRKFTILPKKLYEEDGEVTPTMKVKRKYVNEAFSSLIESMYGQI